MKHLSGILIFALCSVLMPGQTFGQFKYPFSPKDAKWNSFTTPNERKAALEIPSDCLSGIKTSELLTLCLDYPYLTDFYAYNSSEEGLNALMSEFNGFKELFGRTDLKPCLIDEVEAINKTLTSAKRTSVTDMGGYTLRFNVLLYMLERTLAAEPMTDAQSQQLQSSIGSLAKIDVIQESVSSGIIDHMSKKLSESSSTDTLYFNGGYYKFTTRYTPAMYPVYAYKLTSADYSTNEKVTIRNSITTNYPGATVVDDATRQYNCHAYAWHMYQGNYDDKIWIGVYDIEGYTDSCPDPYWETGTYYEVDESEASIVTYGTPWQITHSAIRLNSNEYLSKWGPLSLVRHSPTNVPSNYGHTYKYYKRYSPNIDGPTLFNTSATYSVTPLPSGYTASWSISDATKSIRIDHQSDEQCNLTKIQNNNVYNATLLADMRFGDYNVIYASKKIYSYTGFYGFYSVDGGAKTQISSPPYFVYYTPNRSLEITSPNLIDATVTTQGDAVPTKWDFNPISGYIKASMPSSGTLVITITSSNGTFNIPVFSSSAAHSIGITQGNGEITVSLPDIDNDDNVIIGKSNLNDDYVMIQRLTTGEVLYYQPITDNVKEVAFPVDGSGLYLIKVRYNGQDTVKKIAVN